jgi:hypothetical protein
MGTCVCVCVCVLDMCAHILSVECCSHTHMRDISLMPRLPHNIHTHSHTYPHPSPPLQSRERLHGSRQLHRHLPDCPANALVWYVQKRVYCTCSLTHTTHMHMFSHSHTIAHTALQMWRTIDLFNAGMSASVHVCLYIYMCVCVCVCAP